MMEEIQMTMMMMVSFFEVMNCRFLVWILDYAQHLVKKIETLATGEISSTAPIMDKQEQDKTRQVYSS